ncbi:MAG TPA: hypothetical protein VF846_03500 [Thermoanaerobaculia bacterium]|jgi:YHS domain-containing protein
MMLAALVLASVLHAPEECLPKGKAAVTAEYQGKTYGFRYDDCREEFLKDPERMSQLYDALLELQAEGQVVEAPRASLVPS